MKQDDRDIKEILNRYMEEKMENLDEEDLLKDVPEPSEEYEKRIKNIIRKKKPLHVRAARLVAGAAIFFLSMLALNGFSIWAFGVNPFETAVSYIEGGSVKQVEMSADTSQEENMAVNDVPTYVPEGMVKVVEEKKVYGQIIVKWENTVKKNEYILYYRDNVNGKTIGFWDNETEKRKKIIIQNHVGEIGIKDKEMVMEWEDQLYVHTIITRVKNISENNLIKMAESVYT